MAINKSEKNFLKRVYASPKGLFSHDDLFIEIGERTSGKIIQKLISEGFIDEVPQKVQASRTEQIEIICYRISEKGHRFFSHFYSKIWFAVKGDLRTVIVAVITALVITLLTNYLVNHSYINTQKF